MSFITDAIAGVFKPVADVIEHVLPSGDAKLQLQGAVLQAQITAATQSMDYETRLLDAKSSIVKAEAQSSSWLASNWRPTTMLTFLVLVVCDAFGWLPFRLAAECWSLLQLGLGGYVVGRSVEKVAPSIVAAVTAMVKK